MDWMPQEKPWFFTSQSKVYFICKDEELLFAPAVYPDMHALVPKSKERCCYGQTFKEVS